MGSNYYIGAGHLPTWHDRYIKDDYTTTYDLDTILFPIDANGENTGFNKDNEPLKYLVEDSTMQTYQTLPNYPYVSNISSKKYVLDGCGHFNTANDATLTDDYVFYRTVELIYLKRVYNPEKESFGLQYTKKFRSESSATSPAFLVPEKMAYYSYIALTGGGGGGAGSIGTNSGSGGGSMAQILIDWTRVNDVTISRGAGGSGGGRATSGSNGSQSWITASLKNNAWVTIYVPGGKGGTYSGDGGAGGGIPTYLKSNGDTGNVDMGLDLGGLYCLDYWQGSSGGAKNTQGTSKTVGDVRYGPGDNDVLKGYTYSGGTSGDIWGGGGGASPMSSGGNGGGTSNLISDYDGYPGSGGSGGGGAKKKSGGATGGKGGDGGIRYAIWVTRY